MIQKVSSFKLFYLLLRQLYEVEKFKSLLSLSQKKYSHHGSLWVNCIHPLPKGEIKQEKMKLRDLRRLGVMQRKNQPLFAKCEERKSEGASHLCLSLCRLPCPLPHECLFTQPFLHRHKATRAKAMSSAFCFLGASHMSGTQ